MPTHPTDYPAFLSGLKARIQASRVRVALAANREILRLYYSIGLDLTHRLATESWGSGVVQRLSQDLQLAFPDMKGFSPRNLRDMRRVYESYLLEDSDLLIWRQLIAKLDSGAETWDRLPWPSDLPDLPWGHLIDLVAQVPDRLTRRWYAEHAIQHGWSRAILGMQIESRLHEREGKAISNFAATLPPPDSDLAQQITRDPYTFDFMTLTRGANEREVEGKLVAHITQFLLALGVGFAFVGRQVRLEIGGEEFFLDLLFYHLHLRCYVVIELKNVPFQAEFAGKMNLYLSAVDSQKRQADDKPSIGLILCKSKNRIVAEYALRDVHKPIGIADWQTQLTHSIPQDLRGSLPSPEELEAELAHDEP